MCRMLVQPIWMWALIQRLVPPTTEIPNRDASKGLKGNGSQALQDHTGGFRRKKL